MSNAEIRMSKEDRTSNRHKTVPSAACGSRFRTFEIPSSCRLRHATFFRGLVLLIAGAVTSGCGYVVRGAYAPDIRSVHVPTFTSDSFRRGVELQLTEAVQKQIQTRTPYRITRGQNADTRLTGHIVEIRKDVVGETMFDDPRELQYSIAVEVTWEDLRSGQVLAQQRIPFAQDAVQLIAHADFAPEVGHSLATATQDAVDNLAEQIVGMMEVPW